MSLVLRDHITHALRQLHTLPLKFLVTYKLCLLTHAVQVDRCSGYIADLMTQTHNLPGRDRPRSAAGNRFELPAIHYKFGDGFFSRRSGILEQFTTTHHSVSGH